MLLVGCAKPHYEPPSREPFPAPDETLLTQVERRGYAIYRHDQAAWIATDLALASGLTQTPARGWITVEPDHETVLVRFVGPCGELTCPYLDVHVGTGAPIVSRPPIGPLPREQMAAWRARELALSSPMRACTPKYNTVVLPHDSGPASGWYVYLLATSESADEIVLTGHHRYLVSAAGDSILKSEPLSRSCIVSRLHSDAEVLLLTHNLHPEPIETHVFTSLNYRLTLAVSTEEGDFFVAGTTIHQIRQR